MLLDWVTWGEQLITLERKCGPVFGAEMNEVSCVEQENGVLSLRRDCIFACQGDRCNGNDEDLMLGFSTLDGEGNPQEMSCYTFDLENDDPDQPDANFIECPIYANHGCFKARGYYFPGDETSIRYYKGCSAYPFEVLGQQGLTCQEPGTGPFRESCKYFCDSDSCNPGGLYDNEFTTVAPTSEPEEQSCHVCEETIDHMQRHVSGDRRCFKLDSTPTPFLTTCPSSRKCTDTLTAEWAPSGEIHYTKKRECGNPAVPNVRPPYVDKQYFYNPTDASGYSFSRFAVVDCVGVNCQMNEETESALAQRYDEGKFQKNLSKAVDHPGR